MVPFLAQLVRVDFLTKKIGLRSAKNPQNPKPETPGGKGERGEAAIFQKNDYLKLG